MAYYDTTLDNILTPKIAQPRLLLRLPFVNGVIMANDFLLELRENGRNQGTGDSLNTNIFDCYSEQVRLN